MKQAVAARIVVKERPDVTETLGKDKENMKGTKKVAIPFSSTSTNVHHVVEIPRHAVKFMSVGSQ